MPRSSRTPRLRIPADERPPGVRPFTVTAVSGQPASRYLQPAAAGEETGSEGAFALARRGMRGQAGALVVAEPTTNRPLCGHKGALWLKATTRGVTAHGSMPEKGVNAAYAAARAVGVREFVPRHRSGPAWSPVFMSLRFDYDGNGRVDLRHSVHAGAPFAA